jgi:hypothetical protein
MLNGSVSAVLLMVLHTLHLVTGMHLLHHVLAAAILLVRHLTVLSVALVRIHLHLRMLDRLACRSGARLCGSGYCRDHHRKHRQSPEFE